MLSVHPWKENSTEWNITLFCQKPPFLTQDYEHLLFGGSLKNGQLVKLQGIHQQMVMLEVRSYLEEPIFQRNADPLSWWKAKCSVYPRLTHVMARRLCIVATSVPSERISSKAGQIITEWRCRINPSKLGFSECQSLLKTWKNCHLDAAFYFCFAHFNFYIILSNVLMFHCTQLQILKKYTHWKIGPFC